MFKKGHSLDTYRKVFVTKYTVKALHGLVSSEQAHDVSLFGEPGVQCGLCPELRNLVKRERLNLKLPI